MAKSKSSNKPSPWWDESSLGDGPVALCVFTLPTNGQDQQAPIVMWAAAVSDQVQALIRPHELAEFICIHSDCVLVCHDAAKLHWALYNHFSKDAKARIALWRFARDGRLVDVMLLDQLLRLAGEEAFPAAEDLDAIDRRWFIQHSAESIVNLEQRLKEQMRSSEPSQELQSAMLANCGAMLRIQNKLDKIIRKASHQSDGVSSAADFGPLGLTVEVQAAIAMAGTSRTPLRMALEGIPAVIAVCDQVYGEARQKLYHDPDARRCFKATDDGRDFKLSKTGFLQPDESELGALLMQLQFTITDRHGGDLPRPAFSGSLPTPMDYGAMLDCNPLLRAWADCEWVATVIRLARDERSKRYAPVYKIIPRVSSRMPDLAVIRHVIPDGLFVASDANQLLVGCFPELKLRALAAVLDHRTGRSVLADQYRAHGQPIISAAAVLSGLGQARFQSLGGQAQQAWAGVATTVIEGLTLQLGDRSILELIRTRRQWLETGANQELSLKGVAALVRQLQDLFPELAELSLGIYERVAKALGCTAEEVRATLRKFDGKAPTATELANWIVRAAASADVALENSWQELCDKNEKLADYILEGLKGLVDHRACGISTGRRRGAGTPNVLDAERLDLADAAVKAALFSLVERGFTLLGYNGQEFAVEVPAGDEIEPTCAEIRNLASDSAGAVLAKVPVVCTCGLRERW